MPTVCLDGALMVDWEAFHTQSQRVFGFPDFYSHNMDAWVDCLSYLRDADNMSSIRLKENDVLEIDILNAETWRIAQPEILAEVLYCIDGINERYADYGESPALKANLR
jgi:hypothetical protein